MNRGNVPAGLCTDCRFARVVRNDRETAFLQCRKSFEDPQFAKYPRLPVLECAGYEGLTEGSSPPGTSDRAI